MPFDFKKEYKEFYMPKNVPPLEGFWWQGNVSKSEEGNAGIDYSRKEEF